MPILFNNAIEVEDEVGTYDIAELLERSIFGEGAQQPVVEEVVEEVPEVEEEIQ